MKVNCNESQNRN